LERSGENILCNRETGEVLLNRATRGNTKKGGRGEGGRKRNGTDRGMFGTCGQEEKDTGFSTGRTFPANRGIGLGFPEEKKRGRKKIRIVDDL